jgi:hypothetical protein
MLTSPLRVQPVSGRTHFGSLLDPARFVRPRSGPSYWRVSIPSKGLYGVRRHCASQTEMLSPQLASYLRIEEPEVLVRAVILFRLDSGVDSTSPRDCVVSHRRYLIIAASE